MSRLNISAADVLSQSTQLKSMGSDVNAIFQQIKSKMVHVQSIWSSPAASKLMDEFQTLNPVFESYLQMIENHANYLSQTALAYEENEAMMENSFHAGS
ncbi:hypothetical protein C815_00676 [Firmicutes bacterium M10-2]|nr:hypothetical protein C815_00676 [Firmicutes bacterium M10-2]